MASLQITPNAVGALKLASVLSASKLYAIAEQRICTGLCAIHFFLGVATIKV